MKDIVKLLQLLTQKFPPLPRCAHSFTLHNGRLKLTLMVTAPAPVFFFDEADLAHEPAWLVAEIVRLTPKEEPVPAA